MNSLLSSPSLFYYFYFLALMALQDTEAKIRDMLKEVLPQDLHALANNLQLDIFQTEDKTKIMILKVSSEIIEIVKNMADLLLNNIKKQYPDYFIYILRAAGSESLKPHQVKKVQEEWIKDLAHPALIQGRKTIITLDGRMEEAIIERRISTKEHELRNKEFVFKKLTERDIRFTLRDY